MSVFDPVVFDAVVFDVAGGTAAALSADVSATATASGTLTSVQQYEPWLSLFFTDNFNQAAYGDLFPGDGTGWWGDLKVPAGAANTIVVSGGEITFDANFVSGDTSKASIRKEGYLASPTLRSFRWYAGDVLDVTIWMKITSASVEDCTLMDIEAIALGVQSPGMRVSVNNGLISLNRAEFGLGDIVGTVACPLGSYFELRLYMELSPESIGRTKMWIGGTLSIDHTGPNMPNKVTMSGLGAYFDLPTRFDRVEIGLTANQLVSPDAVVVVDKIELRERVAPKHQLSMMGFGKADW